MDVLRERYLGVAWMRSAPGRGVQMNEGARRARGRWLVFLHADTRLGAGWIDVLRRLDPQPRVAGGSFRFALDSPRRCARWIEWGVRIRVRLFDLRLRGPGVVRTTDSLRGAGRISGAAADGGRRLHPSSETAWLPRACRRAGADVGEAMGARRLVAPDAWKTPSCWRCFWRGGRPSAWRAGTIAEAPGHDGPRMSRA